MYIYQDEVTLPKDKLKNLDFDWKGKSVIELGANIGKLGVYVLEQGAKNYKGYDIDSSMVQIGIERYSLDLEQMDITKGEFEADVVVAMALFHHLKEKDLIKVMESIHSKELVFEVPVGSNDVGLYNTRTLEKYTKLIEKCYGEIVELIESGATNDPYNKRTIFYCRKK